MDAVDAPMARRMDTMALDRGVVADCSFAVVPCYWAAERASPASSTNFLSENMEALRGAGWQGDLYGAAHARPAPIWLWWLAAAFAMVAAGGRLARSYRHRRDDASRRLVRDSWCAYLMLWTLAPMLFFTVSGNVLVTYVLPGIPRSPVLLRILAAEATDVRACAFAVRLMLACGIAVLVLFVGVLCRKAAIRRRTVAPCTGADVCGDARQTNGDSWSTLASADNRPSSMPAAGGQGRRREGAVRLSREPEADFFAVREGDCALAGGGTRRAHPLGKFGEYRLLREAPR